MGYPMGVLQVSPGPGVHCCRYSISVIQSTPLWRQSAKPCSGRIWIKTWSIGNHSKLGNMPMLPIWQRLEFKLSVLVFNCLHNLALSYLSTMCQPVTDNAGRRHLRSAARGDLAVPATRTLRYGPRSITMAGPSTWNSLPALPRSCHLTSTFRRDLKTELFIRAYH